MRARGSDGSEAPKLREVPLRALKGDEARAVEKKGMLAKLLSSSKARAN